MLPYASAIVDGFRTLWKDLPLKAIRKASSCSRLPPSRRHANAAPVPHLMLRTRVEMLK